MHNRIMMGLSVMVFMALTAAAGGAGAADQPALAATRPGVAGEPGQGGGHEKGMSPELREKVKALRQAFMSEQKNLLGLLKQKKEAMRNLLKDPNVSRQQVDPLAGEIKSLQAKLMDNASAHVFKMKEIFTPEQFARFQQMRGQRQTGGKNEQGWRREGRRDKNGAGRVAEHGGGQGGGALSEGK